MAVAGCFMGGGLGGCGGFQDNHLVVIGVYGTINFVCGLSVTGNPVHHHNLLNRVQTVSPVMMKSGFGVTPRPRVEHDSQD